MSDFHSSRVRKAPLAWWIGGILLGLTQILAVAVKKPLGVSTQFVVVDSVALHRAAPDYAKDHPLIDGKKYKSFGYGWWLDVGLVAGALLAAVVTLRWRPRFLVAFFGGFLILFGARLAHGCTSGQFAGGWAQLSLSALPFTVGLFGAGMIVARIIYPKTPDIER
jgi:hypothetical protein